jgi:hypothetical protein
MTRTCFETISRATAVGRTPPGSPRYELGECDRPSREVGGRRPQSRRGHLGIDMETAGHWRIDLLVAGGRLAST